MGGESRFKLPLLIITRMWIFLIGDSFLSAACRGTPSRHCSRSSPPTGAWTTRGSISLAWLLPIFLPMFGWFIFTTYRISSCHHIISFRNRSFFWFRRGSSLYLLFSVMSLALQSRCCHKKKLHVTGFQIRNWRGMYHPTELRGHIIMMAMMITSFHKECTHRAMRNFKALWQQTFQGPKNCTESWHPRVSPIYNIGQLIESYCFLSLQMLVQLA